MYIYIYIYTRIFGPPKAGRNYKLKRLINGTSLLLLFSVVKKKYGLPKSLLLKTVFLFFRVCSRILDCYFDISMRSNAEIGISEHEF